MTVEWQEEGKTLSLHFWYELYKFHPSGVELTDGIRASRAPGLRRRGLLEYQIMVDCEFPITKMWPGSEQM